MNKLDVVNKPIHVGASLWHILVLDVLIGVALTFLIGVIFKSSYPNVDSAKQFSITCDVVGAANITETAYGLPLAYLKTFNNSCNKFPNTWQPIGLLVDVALSSVVASGLVRLMRRIKL